MNRSLVFFSLLFWMGVHFGFAQEKEQVITTVDSLTVTAETTTDTITQRDRRKLKRKEKRNRVRPYEPLAPARAAFYSAVLPGLGQAYQGTYWKIPIIYGLFATTIYFYQVNTDNYDRVRDAFKSRLAGFRNDEFLELDAEGNVIRERISTDGLIRFQERFRKEQELYILLTVGVHLLNIIDANVTAHLKQYNINENLSLRPKLHVDPFRNRSNFGLSLNYNF